MSDEIRLWCWVYRDDVNSLFPVDIPKNKTVGDLKDSIREKIFIRFRDMEARMLRLYSTIIPVDLDDAEYLKDEFNRWSREGKSCLDSRTIVSKLFPPDKGKEPLIIVDGPNAGASLSRYTVALLMTNFAFQVQA